jgi:hypothetical protein
MRKLFDIVPLAVKLLLYQDTGRNLVQSRHWLFFWRVNKQ